MSVWDKLESIDKDQIEKKKSLKPDSGKRKALADTTAADVRRAVGASMRGSYWSRTMRLPPEYETLLHDIAATEGFGSLADAERWVVAMGLYAYYELKMRPEFEKTVTRTVLLPDIKQA
jgi:hypothetical protein